MPETENNVQKGFNFTAVGRIANIDSKMQETGANRGTKVARITLEAQGDPDYEPTQLQVTAYRDRAVEASRFQVGDDVTVTGRVRGRVWADKLGEERSSAYLTVGKIEKVDPEVAQGFNVELHGTVAASPRLGETKGKGHAVANVMLEHEFNPKYPPEKVEFGAFRAVAMDASTAQVGDEIVAKGDVSSRLDANGYTNTNIVAREVVNLTPHINQTVAAEQPAASEPAVAPAV